MNMTKSTVKKALGVTSDAELARFFGIGRAAVNFWGDEEPIPNQRQWELRARRPDLFEPLAQPAVPAANDSPDQAAGEVADAA